MSTMEDTATSPLVFKIAEEPWEFEEIHKLNYETFVEEIPQHHRNPEHRLVDRFHEQNTYFICLAGRELLGMVAIRGERPFSLDEKLENLDSYLPTGLSLCEVRLLAVRKTRRNGQALRGLLRMAAEYSALNGYDAAVISGAIRQEKLYRHMGFTPFGPRVGTEEAPYQPMYIAWDAFNKNVARAVASGVQMDGEEASGPEEDLADFRKMVTRRMTARPMINLLPGPVGVHPDVLKVFSAPPISHRSDQFVKDIRDTQRMLCRLVGSKYAELLQGSGTLANDVIATELTLLGTRGLVLSNGEFGERLVDHAKRAGLECEVLRSEWGGAFDYDSVEQSLRQHGDIGWAWFVHCETSTGILNDMERMADICRKRNVKLCADAISSIGTVPVSLGNIYLASCVSGKGIASLPGLAMVFHNHEIAPDNRNVPRYLDLALYSTVHGVPFTMSSNLLYALRTALKRIRSPEQRFERIRTLSKWLRQEIRRRGFRILAPDEKASPVILTIVLPAAVNSQELGRKLEARGCLLSYNSEYLVRRNWIQILGC